MSGLQNDNEIPMHSFEDDNRDECASKPGRISNVGARPGPYRLSAVWCFDQRRADPFALRVANLLVGNDEGAAGLEITLGGLQLRFEDERIVAWCGGEFDVQIGSRALPAGHVAHVKAGDELKFGRPQIGCRCWLAISGGIDLPDVLGSRSTDLRANFGGLEGRMLRDGDQLSLGAFRRSQTAATEDISSWAGPHDWVSPAKPLSDFAFLSRRGLEPL